MHALLINGLSHWFLFPTGSGHRRPPGQHWQQCLLWAAHRSSGAGSRRVLQRQASDIGGVGGPAGFLSLTRRGIPSRGKCVLTFI